MHLKYNNSSFVNLYVFINLRSKRLPIYSQVTCELNSTSKIAIQNIISTIRKLNPISKINLNLCL